MGLSVKKGSFASPGATGDQAITGLGFQPKAILFWYSQATADGQFHGPAQMALGAATRDGGSTQQWYVAMFEDDATASSSTGGIQNTTAALKGCLNSNPAVDFALTLSTFDSDGFTVNWSDLPATASTVIHYQAFGGADITGARCFSFTTSTAVATQNVTVNTGFGQPDLLLLAPTGFTSLGDATAAAGQLNLSAAISATERRACAYKMPYSNGTMANAVWHGNRALVTFTATGTGQPALDSEADLSSKASWPTDGFQLTYADQAASAQQVFGLALKGTFTATIGSNTAPTSAAPQAQDLALASGTPVGAILFGAPVASAAGIQTSATDLGGWFVGGTDGTNEGVAGFTSQDAAADETVGRFHSTGKAIQFCTYAATATAAPDLDSEADSSVSGSNIRLTWGDTDTVAREYSYLLLGSTGGGGPVTDTATRASATAAAKAPTALITAASRGSAAASTHAPGALRTTAGRAIGTTGTHDPGSRTLASRAAAAAAAKAPAAVDAVSGRAGISAGAHSPSSLLAAAGRGAVTAGAKGPGSRLIAARAAAVAAAKAIAALVTGSGRAATTAAGRTATDGAASATDTAIRAAGAVSTHAPAALRTAAARGQMTAGTRAAAPSSSAGRAPTIAGAHTPTRILALLGRSAATAAAHGPTPGVSGTRAATTAAARTITRFLTRAGRALATAGTRQAAVPGATHPSRARARESLPTVLTLDAGEATRLRAGEQLATALELTQNDAAAGA